MGERNLTVNITGDASQLEATLEKAKRDIESLTRPNHRATRGQDALAKIMEDPRVISRVRVDAARAYIDSFR